METARPGSPAASHGCLCAALGSGVKGGMRGYLVAQWLAMLCASVRFRGNLHHFFPCLSGTNARVSLLERDRSADGGRRIESLLRPR